MIDQTPYIGSRPMPLETLQRRREVRAHAGGTFVGILLVAAVITVPLVWHLALALPALLWGAVMTPAPEDPLQADAFDVPATVALAKQYIADLDLPFASFAQVGSSLYMPDPSDVDFVVLLDADGADALEFAHDICKAPGSEWQECADYDTEDGEWCAVRRGRVNLMLTHSRDFFDGYVLAMRVCEALRLKTKAERIAVCRIVRDGKSVQDARVESGLVCLDTPARDDITRRAA